MTFNINALHSNTVPPTPQVESAPTEHKTSSNKFATSDYSSSGLRPKSQADNDVAASNSSFKQIARGKRSTDANSQPVVRMQEGGEQYRYYLEHGNLWGYIPSGKPPTSHPGVPENPDPDDLQANLDKYDMDHKYNVGDHQLTQIVSKAMLEQKDIDGPSPLIDIPKDSTLSGWLAHLRNAFNNGPLKFWADNNNVDLKTLSYNPSLKKIEFQTRDGSGFSVPVVTFNKRYPTARDAITPLVEAGDKLVPKGSNARLAAWPEHKAPLDVVQGFYGIQPPKDLEASHEWGKRLEKDKEFPEHTTNPPHNDWLLERQQRKLEGINKGFETRPKYEVEYESSADQLHGDLKAFVLKEKNPADYQLYQSVADTLQAMKAQDMDKPMPEVSVEGDTSFKRWMDLNNMAFKNVPLTEWAKKHDAKDFSYDPTTETFHATVAGEPKKFTVDEFKKQYPEFSDALKPLIEVGKVIAPVGSGLQLKPLKDDKAPIDMLLEFYEIQKPDNTLESFHDTGKKLKEHQVGFSETSSWRSGDENFEHSRSIVEKTNTDFLDSARRGVIEYSGPGRDIYYE